MNKFVNGYSIIGISQIQRVKGILGTFTNSEDLDEIMCHFIRVYSVKLKKSSDKKMQSFL